MAKRRKSLHPDAPLLHRDHSRPVTRRDFLRQGFISGTGMVMSSSILSLFANPRVARAALSPDILARAGELRNAAGVPSCILGAGVGAGKIPFICFDLAGGANICGSNVLVGGPGGQLDFLSTAGYSKMGLPGDMVPGGVEPAGFSETGTSNGDFIDESLGLRFHADSAFLRGILEKAPGVIGSVNGAVIPARSDNDTGNNPHNPMYGIAKAGRQGSVVSLIGSRNSDSGGNSMAPAMLFDPEIRPTKVDRPTDVTGMVDTGNLLGVLDNKADVVAVMESVARLSDIKMGLVEPGITNSEVIRDLVRCGYFKAADLADRFADVKLDPGEDGFIVDGADPDNVTETGIFTRDEFNSDREFQKTAAVMKMVIDGADGGYAGAGTIAMGGYDYHTGDRSTGELRDLRAGRCIGACLDYARRKGQPLMIYVFSDGSLASNGTVLSAAMDPDNRGKPVWTGDNSSTAAAFFLVYNPSGMPQLRGVTLDEQLSHQQIGYFRADGSVETSSSPAANNVNLLVETVILNYMALNGDIGLFPGLFTGFGASPSPALLDSLTAFGPLA